jgi:nitrite reductase (NO-forming)
MMREFSWKLPGRLAGFVLLLSLVTAGMAQARPGAGISYIPDVTVTLTTGIAAGKLVFIGVGGDIDGVINPDLHFQPGQVVQLVLINGDGTQHDLIAPDVGAATDIVTELGASTATVFQVGEEGTYDYWCSLPGHRAAGMEGSIIVGEGGEEAAALASIVRDPTDLPPPLEAREPVTHDITLTTTELEARLADGTSYRYWTFDDLVPGPFLRVRVGDTVNVKLHNAPDSTMLHSVDFHAVTGPGGGAVATQTLPGETTEFSFKAIIPGLFVYHCATPMVAHHITNGMYGLILVEPEEGLPEVDHEFYVMQGEIYTQNAFGMKGPSEFSVEKLLNEQPEYLTFNGSVGALTDEFPMYARVGETVRIFFGVGGPNKASSFHVIGEMFDRVYNHGSFSHEPLRDVQTILVPPGGATIVEFALEVPGRYILVDHALSRLERGLAGFLHAEGDDNLEIYSGPDSGAGH